MAGAAGMADPDGPADTSSSPTDGVIVGGQPAENLFVFDADGNRVDGAQIVDQDGDPVILQPSEGEWRTGAAEQSATPVPLGAFDHTVPLNAYPYSVIAPSQATLLGDGTWEWNGDAVEQPRWPAYERVADEPTDTQADGSPAGDEPTDED